MTSSEGLTVTEVHPWRSQGRVCDPGVGERSRLRRRDWTSVLASHSLGGPRCCLACGPTTRLCLSSHGRPISEGLCKETSALAFWPGWVTRRISASRDSPSHICKDLVQIRHLQALGVRTWARPPRGRGEPTTTRKLGFEKRSPPPGFRGCGSGAGFPTQAFGLRVSSLSEHRFIYMGAIFKAFCFNELFVGTLALSCLSIPGLLTPGDGPLDFSLRSVPTSRVGVPATPPTPLQFLLAPVGL